MLDVTNRRQTFPEETKRWRWTGASSENSSSLSLDSSIIDGAGRERKGAEGAIAILAPGWSKASFGVSFPCLGRPPALPDERHPQHRLQDPWV